ncbi:putative toxin [Microbulbifer sp. MLAF003]|uniref:putative toxin n=1 Tax=Microbulbifer sp. MLAF003 TaxID=3032582 RepID=UPI0024AD6576|nr:putative toxin [Microbulbifer sp. MLAF003]WHI49542.1 putative toxin [Microbulbifer sp. MLAF003]
MGVRTSEEELLAQGIVLPEAKGSSKAKKNRAKSVTKSPGQLGREGEAAASAITGVGKNTQKFAVNGSDRIPDQVNASNISTRNPLHLTEVKNVKSQSFTRQLRDNVDLVGPGGRVDVFVRPNTKLSGPLKRANADPTNPINIRPEL